MRHLSSAYWAVVFVLEPWLDTVWVVNMLTWQYHTFFSKFKIRQAYWTTWLFKLSIMLIRFMFAMTFINFSERYPVDHIWIGWSSILLFLLLLHLLLSLTVKWNEEASDWVHSLLMNKGKWITCMSLMELLSNHVTHIDDTSSLCSWLLLLVCLYV